MRRFSKRRRFPVIKIAGKNYELFCLNEKCLKKIHCFQQFYEKRKVWLMERANVRGNGQRG
jgi:hypothetical protein